MNSSNFVALKMGNKFIFKESLQVLKGSNSKYLNSNVQKKNYYTQNYYNNNQRITPKRNYQDMDIIPKFIANQNMQEINKELLERTLTKKSIFNKMMKTYFAETTEYFSNSIQEIEMEMNSERISTESTNNKDFDGFKELLSIINNNRTNPKLTSMKNISLDFYKIMDKETKNQILEGIKQNKALFSEKLNLKNIKNINNNNYNFDKNPYIINKQKPQAATNTNKKKGKQQNLVTGEQIDLFKIFIRNQNISNQDALSYFDMGNPKVITAAERYFKKLYGADSLTLQFFYPYQKNLGTKVHRFIFISKISELFMAAHKDYLSLNNPRLYLENGKEILDDKRIKCVGALGLPNNSKIKVVI